MPIAEFYAAMYGTALLLVGMMYGVIRLMFSPGRDTPSPVTFWGGDIGLLATAFTAFGASLVVPWMSGENISLWLKTLGVGTIACIVESMRYRTSRVEYLNELRSKKLRIFFVLWTVALIGSYHVVGARNPHAVLWPASVDVYVWLAASWGYGAAFTQLVIRAFLISRAIP